MTGCQAIVKIKVMGENEKKGGRIIEIDLTRCLVCNKGNLSAHDIKKLYVCDNRKCRNGISIKELKRCPVKDCHKKFVPIKDPLTDTINGQLFQPACKHFPENCMISVG